GRRGQSSLARPSGSRRLGAAISRAPARRPRGARGARRRAAALRAREPRPDLRTAEPDNRAVGRRTAAGGRARHRAPLALPADDRARHALRNRRAAGGIHAARGRSGGGSLCPDPRVDRGGRPPRLRDQQSRPAGGGEPSQPRLLALPRLCRDRTGRAWTSGRLGDAWAPQTRELPRRRGPQRARARRGAGPRAARARRGGAVDGTAAARRRRPGRPFAAHQRARGRSHRPGAPGFPRTPRSRLARGKPRRRHAAGHAAARRAARRTGARRAGGGMNRTDLLEAWSRHLSDGRRRSPHTVRAYVAAASRLIDRTGAGDWAALARLDASDLRAQLAERRAEGIGNVSAARELSALKAFLTFAREQAGHAEPTPPRLRGPRIKKGLPRPVTPDDVTNLADVVRQSAAEDWIGARDRAVLLLMYGAGLRIAEALSLKGSDLPLGETLAVTGKGGKQRIVPL